MKREISAWKKLPQSYMDKRASVNGAVIEFVKRQNGRHIELVLYYNVDFV